MTPTLVLLAALTATFSVWNAGGALGFPIFVLGVLVFGYLPGHLLLRALGLAAQPLERLTASVTLGVICSKLAWFWLVGRTARRARFCALLPDSSAVSDSACAPGAGRCHGRARVAGLRGGQKRAGTRASRRWRSSDLFSEPGSPGRRMLAASYHAPRPRAVASVSPKRAAAMRSPPQMSAVTTWACATAASPLPRGDQDRHRRPAQRPSRCLEACRKRHAILALRTGPLHGARQHRLQQVELETSGRLPKKSNRSALLLGPR